MMEEFFLEVQPTSNKHWQSTFKLLVRPRIRAAVSLQLQGVTSQHGNLAIKGPAEQELYDPRLCFSIHQRSFNEQNGRLHKETHSAVRDFVTCSIFRLPTLTQSLVQTTVAHFLRSS